MPAVLIVPTPPFRWSIRRWYCSLVALVLFFSPLLGSLPVYAATLLSDSFTGTTIDTVKWNEVDPGGTGGSSGNVQQNGTLTVGSSYNGSIWGQRALYSVDTFPASGLEISAVMTNNSDQLLGYGDYNFNSAGTKAYMLDMVGSTIYALVWNNNALAASNLSCGTFVDGATYKIKIISGGFEVYKNDVLQCTLSTAVAIDNKPVFLQSSGAASVFDDVLVTGTGAATVPDAPTSLSATPGNTQISLSWTAPASNGGSAITDYVVEYKASSSGTWGTFSDGTSTSTSATVTGLTNATSYDFRVSAVNAIGTGTTSGTATATPSPPTAPAAPTIGTAVAGNASASVSFTPGSTGGSAITGYTVTSSPGGITATGSSSPITVTGLTNGTAYTFTVTATNAIGTSSASSASNAVTPNQEVPSSISGLALWLDGSDSANITHSSGSITQVSDKSGNNKHATATGSVSPTLVSAALNGRSVMRFDGSNDYLTIGSSVAYRTIAVVAKYSPATTFADYNGIIGDFTGSSPSNGHVLNGVVGTSKLASATSNYTSAYRNGDLVAGSGGHAFSPIDQYWIGVFELPSAMTNTTSAIGMINGGGRYWNGDIAEVIVYNGTITTTQRQTLENYLSNKWNITVSGPTVPGIPTSLGAARGNTQISLSWTAPASNGGSAITDYVVEYKASSSGTWGTFSDGTSTSTSATVTGLTNATSYDFRVSAVNAIGTGTASGTATKTPGPAIAPDPPTGATAEGGNAQATVSFTPPVDNGGSAITGYTVTSSPGGITATGSASPITVTGLTNATAYTFTVTATNAIGTSSASSATSAVTPSLLGNQLTDTFTGTTINPVKWYELDPTGSGGASGKIQQNGSLTVADSYASSTWGATALISQDRFDATSLEISASITAGSSPLIGYGDYNFSAAGKKAYLLYLTAAGSQILALSWDNQGSSQTSCGTAAVGAATYKLKVISGGFEVYKDGVLQCTHTTATVVNNQRVFLQSSTTASTFDDLVVYGLPPTDTAPDAPTIGSATAGNASAVVTFTGPNYNGGSAITGYTVTSSPGGITATGSSSPITVTGLTNGTAYTFTVTATNAIGTSSASSATSAVTPSLPPAPGQVTALTATGFNRQVLLGWDAPTSGATPTDYVVQYKLGSANDWSTFADGTSTTLKAVVTGLANASAYDFRVLGSNDGSLGAASATASATPDELDNLAFVITGESNSGGIGLNSDATVGELASRSAVQILELTSGNFLFEALDIGTNNLRDHAGLEGYYANSHGFELQLANSTEAHAFPDNPTVRLIKTGQGGSAVSQWNLGGGYWTKFLQRTAAAKTQLDADRKWVVWLSLGINDGIAGTNITSFKTDMTNWIDRIKADLPGAVILMTQFQSMSSGSGYPSINTALSDIAALEQNVYVIDTTGAGLRDGNHWSYAGLKTVASSMVTSTKNLLGLNYPGKPTGLAATPTATSAALSWTAPVSNGGSSITDYVIEYKPASGTAWSTFADGTSTGTSATVTGLSGSTAYDFRVKAVNANGQGNPVNASATTLDGTAPVLSSVSAVPGSTTATITWTTDEAASSIIQYGLTNAYGSTTAETDTSPRVTSHSVALSSLLSCTTYHYRVRSNDASANLATGSDATFTTTGCTGSAPVAAQVAQNVSSAGGGSVSLLSSGAGLSMSIPAGATGSDATYQLKRLTKANVIASVGNPGGVTSVGDYVFDLKSLSNVSTANTSFLQPITLTFTYQESDVAGLDESSLRIYRHNGSAWSALSGCTVNTVANTVACPTSQFSVFSLFGQAAASSSAASGIFGAVLPPSVFHAPRAPQNGFSFLVNAKRFTRIVRNRSTLLTFIAGPDTASVAVSTRSDFSDAVIEPFAQSKSFDLCSSFGGTLWKPTCPDGKYSIWVRFHSASGVASDPIMRTVTLRQPLRAARSVLQAFGVSI